MDFDINLYREKMQKTIQFFSEDLASIRVGRANPKLLEKIMVPYYGTPSSLEAVATIKTPDARTLLIAPWEVNLLKEIEKAIQASDLGITPQNDGKQIRLSFPSLTEERRRELTKQVAKQGEEAKVALRNVRREANEKAKELKKNSIFTEDELIKTEKEIQELTDNFTKEVDLIVESKNKDIMEF